jgi:hypothetical protein
MRLRKDGTPWRVRQPNPRRQHYKQLYGLTKRECRDHLKPAHIEQLDACKDDESRRLLMGCSGCQADASDAAGMPSCEELGRLELDFETQKGGF